MIGSMGHREAESPYLRGELKFKNQEAKSRSCVFKFSSFKIKKSNIQYLPIIPDGG